MWFLLFIRLIISLLLGLIIARRGLKRGSLSRSGALAAFFVGSIILFSNFSMGLSLIIFYLSGSALTRYKENFKMTVDLDAKKGGGQRNYLQVLCTAGIPTLACICLLFQDVTNDGLCSNGNEIRKVLIGVFLGALSCVAGDTFASELGILSTSEPFLITTFERVPIRYGTGKWARMLIDATVNMDFPPEEQYGGDRYPPSVMPSKEDWAAVEKRWKEFGFK